MGAGGRSSVSALPSRSPSATWTGFHSWASSEATASRMGERLSFTRTWSSLSSPTSAETRTGGVWSITTGSLTCSAVFASAGSFDFLSEATSRKR